MEKIVFRKDDEVGVTWFIPDEPFTEGVPCTGVIREKYAEGSVYEGQGRYDGKEFYRQGYGVQNFESSNLTGELMGGPKGCKPYKFIGGFDRDLGGWMYGNGIMYYTDKDGKPLKFAKGFFESINAVYEWRGTFDKDLLIPGYTPDMEWRIIPYCGVYDKIVAKYKDVKDVDYVVFGDSWTEVWTNAETMGGGPEFDEEVKLYGLNAINVGIGGTRYYDWFNLVDELVISHNPKVVLINLGFNDVHCSFTAEKVFGHFKKMIAHLKNALPNLKIYVNAVCHCSPFKDMFAKETAFNKLVEDYVKSCDFMTYIPTNKLFMDGDTPITNMDDYCIADHFHLNRKGYDIWAKKVLETIKNDK